MGEHQLPADAIMRLTLTMYEMPNGSIDVEMGQFCSATEDFARAKKALIAAVVYVERQIKAGGGCPFNPKNAPVCQPGGRDG